MTSPPTLDEPPQARLTTRLRARLARLPRRIVLLNTGLALGVIAVLSVGVLSLGARSASDSGVRTVAVTRGTVTAKVTGTGNAASSVSTPVSFVTPGVVTAVNVEPGDQVTRGQLLATIDPATATSTLRTARAQLASARAALAEAAAGPTDVKAQQDQLAVTQAKQGVDNANSALAAARRQRVLDQQSTDTAIANARTELATDRTAQDNAVRSAQINEDAACATPAPAATPTPSASAGSTASSCTAARHATKTAQDNRSADLGKDQQAITSAQQSQAATLQKDDDAIRTSQQQVTSAQGQVTSARLAQQAGLHPETPEQIAQAQASVDSAQVQVDDAQRAVDQTRLVAPQDGVVLAVNGKVGESSSAGSSGSSGSAGSVASAAGGAASAAGSGGAASAASAAATSGGSGFIVIANLSELAVTANIAEADTAKIKLGQQATVTFPATGATAGGSVTEITPQSTVINNVVLYPITVSLDAAPAGVGVGSTADLSITTGTATGVLQVPTAAITTLGTRHTVTVRAADGTQSVVAVEVGVTGDDTTEIIGGVTDGEQLVLPSGSVSATGGFPRGGGGG